MKPQYFFEIPVTVVVNENGDLISATIWNYEARFAWTAEGDEVSLEDTPIPDKLLTIEGTIQKALDAI